MKMKDGSEERRAKMEESLSVESNQKGKSRHLKSRRPHFHSELATHLSNTCTLTKTSLQTAYTYPGKNHSEERINCNGVHIQFTPHNRKCTPPSAQTKQTSNTNSHRQAMAPEMGIKGC